MGHPEPILVTLDLAAFGEGTPALSPAVTAALAEAAVCCLEGHDHQPGVILHTQEARYPITWRPLDPRALASHADRVRATEDGAVAVAIVLLEAGTPWRVVQQSLRGTGYDWVLSSGAGDDPFGGAACLEVSGVHKGTLDQVEDRVRSKRCQVAAGGGALPGYVAVVEFSRPTCQVVAVP